MGDHCYVGAVTLVAKNTAPGQTYISAPGERFPMGSDDFLKFSQRSPAVAPPPMTLPPLYALFADSARRPPDKMALIIGPRRLRYAELADSVEHLAAHDRLRGSAQATMSAWWPLIVCHSCNSCWRPHGWESSWSLSPWGRQPRPCCARSRPRRCAIWRYGTACLRMPTCGLRWRTSAAFASASGAMHRRRPAGIASRTGWRLQPDPRCRPHSMRAPRTHF